MVSPVRIGILLGALADDQVCSLLPSFPSRILNEIDMHPTPKE
jgi:hypothetical protein